MLGEPKNLAMTSETVRRVALPSGGWWDLIVRPRWKHVRDFLCIDERLASLCDRERLGPASIAERALASLTTGWSFREPVSAESLAHRDRNDLMAVMGVLEREVVPALGDHDPRALAEELFEGLARGSVPHEFAEVHIMARTGWSWATLQETPADVVERMALYLAVTQAREAEGTLEFAEEEHGR